MSILATAQTAYDAGDYDRVLQLLLPLAEEGSAEAQCLIGSIYHLGLGSTEANESKAENWYALASSQGHGLASNNLAALIGSSDRQRALALYQLASAQGFSHAPIFYSNRQGG
jgi:TPR repeat protein